MWLDLQQNRFSILSQAVEPDWSKARFLSSLLTIVQVCPQMKKGKLGQKLIFSCILSFSRLQRGIQEQGSPNRFERLSDLFGRLSEVFGRLSDVFGWLSDVFDGFRMFSDVFAWLSHESLILGRLLAIVDGFSVIFTAFRYRERRFADHPYPFFFWAGREAPRKKA